VWEDIDRVKWQIEKEQKKTRDFVYIPLNETARGLIDDKKAHRFNEAVFPILAGARSNNQSEILNKWAKGAGVEKRIGWHTARHTFAVLSLEAGAELYTVSKLLGHTDIKTRQVYAKVTDKLKRAAVDALPKIAPARN
jgi:site-specific recombinase XerD